MKLRTIIAGSRTITDISEINEAVLWSGFDIGCVVSGCARGVDLLGEKWAKQKGIPVARYPAKWDEFGKSAGYKRNVEMSENADALVAVWDGKSSGTGHMIRIAQARGLRMYVHKV